MSDHRTKRVLVIDDDAGVRRSLRDLVISLGYEAEAAASGREGLALFEQSRYDILLTDLLMPEMTGWEVLETVRHANPTMPVIIVSGATVYADDRRLARPGVTLLQKPVDAHFLEIALARALAESK